MEQIKHALHSSLRRLFENHPTHIVTYTQGGQVTAACTLFFLRSLTFEYEGKALLRHFGEI